MRAIISFLGGGGAYIVANPEFNYSMTIKPPYVYPYDAIFPLGTIQFEGFTFPAPHDPHKILTTLYGDYMSFPHEGVVHHGGDKRAAERGVTDLDALLVKLEAAEKFFTSQI